MEVGKGTIELKTRIKTGILEILCNVFVLNFIALLFLYAFFGGEQ